MFTLPQKEDDEIIGNHIHSFLLLGRYRHSYRASSLLMSISNSRFDPLAHLAGPLRIQSEKEKKREGERKEKKRREKKRREIGK
jgi:hypothetical protein